jgi:hypothetical protein
MTASVSRTLFGCLFGPAIAVVLLPASADAIKLPNASRDSVYEYIDTPAFADSAREFYLKTIAPDVNRQKLIAQAKDDCGGRYEGTSVSLVELSHSIETDKNPPEHPGRSYTLYFLTKATVRWLAVETISCSILDGHAQSLLHAAFVTGTETERVTYHYVNDKETGKPSVSDVKRVYKLDAGLLTDQYGLPYSQQ